MDKKSIKSKLKDWSAAITVGVLILGVAIAASIFAPAQIVDNTTNDPIQENVSVSAENVEFAMPVEGGVLLKDYSANKLKYNATLKQWEAHKGVDIGAAEGTFVLAATDGTITNIETTHLKGTSITITHKDGLSTTYSSLAEDIAVKLNETVKRGQKIGKVSTSAKGESADGAHLHFEVIKDGVKVDPNLYLNFGNK